LYDQNEIFNLSTLVGKRAAAVIPRRGTVVFHEQCGRMAVPRIQSIFAIVSLLVTIGCRRNQRELNLKLMRDIDAL
jgi:hypothetical protein